MSRPISISSAVTFYPAGTTGASNITGSTSYPYSNGYNGTGNTSNYARLQLNASSTSTDCYIYYTFNVSGIPSNATITSVSCVARIYANSRVTTGTSDTSASIQLYNGTTGKGSAQRGISTTAANVTISNTGSWTVSELNNIRLRITGRRSATNNSSYIYFYGANLTINYSVNGTAYTVTASSDYTGATVSPSEQEVMNGESCTIRIDTDDINKIVIEDNGVDITDLVETKINVLSGTSTKYATGFTTGVSSSNANFYMSQNQTGTTRLQYPIGYLAESPHEQSDSQYTYIKDNNNNTATGWINYKFDFSDIPENAVIKSVRISAYGARESTNTSSQYKAMLGAYYGNTLKGATQEFTSTSNQILTLSNIGTWTREELQDAQVRFTVAYYGGRIYGVTFEVEWESQSDNSYYYEYTLTNINDDHNIIVSESIYIPPEEDPEKTYYSLTISSINATTDPKRGTTRVESGDGQTITITPSDPQVTLILDNGVDVSSQLVQHGGNITSSITTVQGASYGFTYLSSTGYYVSQNKGISKSAAVCKVNFNLPVRCLVTIQFINYAEQGYDFGVFGNIDTTLTNNYYAAGSGGATITDSNYKLACNTSSYNSSSPQTLTYEIPSGEHFIYIKYSKDDASDDNNDTLQFKILNIEPLEANNYYTYTLSNINQDHSLIFIFGNVSYYFVESSLNGEGRINPAGQMVQLQGDNYKLTIVPSNANDSVSITDNNVDVTGNLVLKQETIEKDGEQYTVTNYIYTLTNIGTGHTILVTVTGGVKVYRKVNGSWVQVSKVWVKNRNTWEEVSDVEELFNEENIYINN